VQAITKTFQFGQHEVTLETGRVARQATGAVVVTMGGVQDMYYQNQSFHLSTVSQASAAARQIATNSFAFKDAPPTRPPSTSGFANNSAAFPAFTLPPYRIRTP
jgi:hypothetical protein